MQTLVTVVPLLARRACVTVYDRVPIKSIERSNVAFNHWFVDIAGPLFPNQKVVFNYCFVACGTNTLALARNTCFEIG